MNGKEAMRALLAVGDRRSVGRVHEVIQSVLLHPKTIAQVVEFLWDSDPGVRMRAADALEKLSLHAPSLLQPYKPALLALLAEASQKELRWHLALLIPRLQLTLDECRMASETLHTYLTDPSSIVKTCALQGLFDLIRQDPASSPGVLDLIHSLTRTGTPAMRARARILR